MPLYEYYCSDCHGVFERLRPAREATDDQPCPECDRDVARIISRDFAVFTFRDGLPRRLPDRGTFWHLGKEVSQPITGATRHLEHPEVDKREPERAPSIEELERFEHRQERKQEAERLKGDVIRDEGIDAADRAFSRRMRRNTGERRRDDMQRKLKREIAEDRQKIEREAREEKRARRRPSD